MTHGQDGPWYYQQMALGFNYRMTDLQAALGVSQMQRLEEYVARRHELAAPLRRAARGSAGDHALAASGQIFRSSSVCDPPAAGPDRQNPPRGVRRPARKRTSASTCTTSRCTPSRTTSAWVSGQATFRRRSATTPRRSACRCIQTLSRSSSKTRCSAACAKQWGYETGRHSGARRQQAHPAQEHQAVLRQADDGVVDRGRVGKRLLRPGHRLHRRRRDRPGGPPARRRGALHAPARALRDDHTGTTAVVGPCRRLVRGARASAPDQVCCLYATAPFVAVEDLRRGLAVLTETGSDYAFSVTRYAFPIQRAIRITAAGRVEMFQPEHFNTRSQDLEEAYHDAGQFYWGRAEAWLRGRMIFGRECGAGRAASPSGAGHRHARGLDARRMAVQGPASANTMRIAEMKAAFRVDASLEIGSGHVMRCLTLADALEAQGANCHFISREHRGHLLELIRQRGHAVTVLPAELPQPVVDKRSRPANRATPNGWVATGKQTPGRPAPSWPICGRTGWSSTITPSTGAGKRRWRRTAAN